MARFASPSSHSSLPRFVAQLLLLLCLLGRPAAASPSDLRATLTHNIPADRAAARARGASSASPSPSCKAAQGTSAWPSAAAWAQLNATTGGRLLQPPPPGAVCHQGAGGGANDAAAANSSACLAVQSAWTNQSFHVANPISSMWQQWNNDSCLPYSNYSCSSDGYPAFVVNASAAEHVKAAVDFARTHNVRLIVKSSGHDYLGRSSAPNNALSIWVHYLNHTKTHDSFTPKGCGCNVRYNASLTAGGGAAMLSLYDAAAAVNQVVVGGGGHSLLSARYGLAADQVIEMEIVTANGELLTLNECQNTDLFWAMRGGGGSTFGVLTSATIKTYPKEPLVNIEFGLGTSNLSNPNFYPMIAYIISQLPALGDQGLSGYGFWAPHFPVAAGVYQAGFFGDFIIQNTTNQTAILAMFEPLAEYINATWPNQFSVEAATTEAYSGFRAWYADHYDMSGAGTDMYVGSRLLSKEAVTTNLTSAAQAYEQFAAVPGIGTAYLVSGKGVANAQIAGGSNAVNPAWRTSYLHATTSITVPYANLTARAEGILALNYSVAALRALDSTSGAYINEADPYEPNFQTTFWGTNYPRLAAIKNATDPDDVFWCTPCVGNERWEEVGDMLCRVS